MASAAQRLANIERKQKRERAEQQADMSRLSAAGAGVVGAGLFSLLTTKFPRMESVDKGGKLQVAPMVSILAVLGGLGAKSPVLYGAGVGIGSNWAAGWVEQQAWAQP